MKKDILIFVILGFACGLLGYGAGVLYGINFTNRAWEKSVMKALGVSNKAQEIYNGVYGWKVSRGKTADGHSWEGHTPRKYIPMP